MLLLLKIVFEAHFFLLSLNNQFILLHLLTFVFFVRLFVANGFFDNLGVKSIYRSHFLHRLGC